MSAIRAAAAASAMAGALTACSLFTSFGDLSAGEDGTPDVDASEAGASETGASEAGGDASQDAPSSDPLGCNDPDLVLAWSFDEGQGTVAFDCGPTKINGIFGGNAGAASWGQRGAGGALEISGGGDVQVESRSELDPPGSMSVMAFVRSDQPPSSYAYLAYHLGSGGSNVYGWELTLDSSGDLYAAIGFGANTVAADFPPLVTARWTHVAFVYDMGASFETYVDGVSVTKKTMLNDGKPLPQSGPVPAPGGRSLYVGATSGGTWRGAVDEVRVYRRALTAGEIKTLAGR